MAIRIELLKFLAGFSAAAEAGKGWLSDPFHLRDASTILNNRSAASFFLPCFA